MNQTQIPKPIINPKAAPPVSRILQRKCTCGGTPGPTGECESCKNKRMSLQRKLTIGSSNDSLELEADRTANQVMAAPSHSRTSNAPLQVQRFSGQTTEGLGAAPASVDRVLSGSGRPLEPALQQDMGQRFGYDFSRVRIHTGSDAEQSAREVNANAYTVGPNVVFGAGRFVPGSLEGRRLIAHELVHVVQQFGGYPRVSRQSASRRTAVSALPIPSPTRNWTTIGAHTHAEPLSRTEADARVEAYNRMDDYVNFEFRRQQIDVSGRYLVQSKTFESQNGKGNRDYPDVYVSRVNINLSNLTSGLRIVWSSETAQTRTMFRIRDYNFSPGLGLCSVCCNTRIESNTPDSLCTPIGLFTVTRNSRPHLDGFDDALYPTEFSRPGIAIHVGSLPARPASHGCARTTNAAAQIIQYNSIVGVTEINVTGNVGSVSRCYPNSARGTVPRARLPEERCPVERRPSRSAAVAGPSHRVHTVVEGESLSQIAQRYHVTIEQLASANRILDASRIQTGQRLTIPEH
jgi:Domain of unknown function (DUF4157)/LysM domain